MAGCGGRRPNMEEEADGRSVEMPPVSAGPESSDDPSAAHPTEDPEKNRVCGKTFKAQLNILETFFKKEPCPIPTELEQLANQLSASPQAVQKWFINRRAIRKKQRMFAHQRPESSDDHRAAHPKESPEYSLKNFEMYEKMFFNEEQLNILETSFKKEPYPTPTEREQLANQLSLPERSIQTWFQNRIIKLKHQPVNSHPESKYQPRTGAMTPTQAQLDLLHMQNIYKNVAQSWSSFDRFPPPQPMDSCMLPQGPHSSDMVYRQNVGGPPDSCSGTEVSKMLPESSHELPNDYFLNLSLPNKTIDPGTNTQTPGSSITTDLTADDRPSTSSTPRTFQMPIAPDYLNLPRTSMWPPVSSITPNMTYYNGPITSFAPSTFQMPIAPYLLLPRISMWPPVSSITPNMTYYNGPITSFAPSTFQMPIAPYLLLPRTTIWPPVSSITTDLTADGRPSTSSAPSTTQMPIGPNTFNLPRTSICTPVSSITIDRTSHDGPSTSSALSTSQMPIGPNTFNLPRTSICTPVSSITYDRTSHDGPSTSSAPRTFQMPIVPYYLNLPRTTIWPPVSSITTDLTADGRPSTSSAPSTTQMPIGPNTFNLPRTSICTPGSSITTDLTADDGPSTSSAPCTPQMPIAWYNADERSSTDCSLVIDEDATYSDQENCSSHRT